MQYDLTEEQLMMQETVRPIANEKLAQGVTAQDEKDTFDRDIKKILEENGIFFLCLPPLEAKSKKER